jgi:hypothetical protein
MESFAKIFALSQNCDPAQTGLKTLEYQELKQSLVLQYWDTPLFIVVRDVKRIAAAPPAARSGNFRQRILLLKSTD